MIQINLSFQRSGFVVSFAQSRKAPISFVISTVSVCLPVCLSAGIGAAPTGRIADNFHTEAVRKICRQTPNLVKIRQKLSDTSHEDLSIFYCRRHKLPIKPFLCNNRHFYAAYSDSSPTIHRTHCCLSITTMVTPTRQCHIIRHEAYLVFPCQYHSTTADTRCHPHSTPANLQKAKPLRKSEKI